MKVSEFKKYMKCGLGRCFIELSTCKSKEKYRSAVLYGCLHSLSYDQQSEGTRSEYVYGLCSLFGDTDYFLLPVIEKFEGLTVGHGDYEHLCDLLSEFARGGSLAARTALEKKYDKLYKNLLARRGGGYDFVRDEFERAAVGLVAVGGLKEFLKIAKDMGNLFLQNSDYCGWDFDWFYDDFCDSFGKAELEKVLKAESLNSPEIKKFYESMQTEESTHLQASKTQTEKPLPTAEEILGLVESGRCGQADFLRFGRFASEEQKRILAEKIMRESDQNKQAELLRAFKLCGFPLGVDGLAELFERANQNLRLAVTDVLEETKDVQAHDMAVDFIEADGDYLAGIRMLVLNYTDADSGLLTGALKNLNIKTADKDGLHALFMKITDAFDDGLNLPKEALFFIYENSFCSCCRESAVELMAERGWLTDGMKAECAYDCNPGIRKIAGKI